VIVAKKKLFLTFANDILILKVILKIKKNMKINNQKNLTLQERKAKLNLTQNYKCIICGGLISEEFLDGDYSLLICEKKECWKELKNNKLEYYEKKQNEANILLALDRKRQSGFLSAAKRILQGQLFLLFSFRKIIQ